MTKDYDAWLSAMYGPDLDGEDQPENQPALDRTGPVLLTSTASTDPSNPPVVIENPNEMSPPPEEEHMWRPATDDEYAAYVTYWDAYYEDRESDPEPEPEPEPEPVSHDRYTVSGNAMRVWRLGPDGQPVGEAINVGGYQSITVDGDEIVDSVLDWKDKSFTMDLTMNKVDPALLSLLTGQGTQPDRLTVWDGRTRCQRFVDNHPVLRWVLGGYDMVGGPGFWDRLLNATFDYRETRKMVDRWDEEDQR